MVLKVTLLAEEWTQSARGGTHSILNRQLAIHLAQHPGVKISLLIPKCSLEDKQDAEKYHVNVVEPELDPIDLIGYPPQGFGTDFILGHDIKLGKQGYLIKRSCGCKWIHVVHTNAEEMGLYMPYPGAISTAQEEHEKQIKLCESADMVVTIGPKLKDSLSSSLRFSGKELFNLTPGIFDEFRDVNQKFQERKTFKILIFGRGDAEDFELKGFDVAAKAVVALGDSNNHLLVVGAPDGRQEELAAKLCNCGISRSQLKVRRLNRDRKQLANLFWEVDLLLMPSGTEAFGLAALEALSAGLPILVTSNSGLAEALREVTLGSQCIVETEDDWAKEIKKVQKNLKTRQKEAKMLRDRYNEKYSWKEQCAVLVEKMMSMHAGNDEMQEKYAFNPSQPPPISRASVVPTPTPAASTTSVTGPVHTEVSQSTGIFKEGKPSDLQLDDLAGKIASVWKKLGIRLGIEKHVLDEIDANADDKPLQMLLRWRNTTSSDTPYRDLYEALCHSRIGQNNLAKEFCCAADDMQKESLNEKGSLFSSKKRCKDSEEDSLNEKDLNAPKRLKAARVGTPSSNELQKLAKEIMPCWKKLGRRLGIEDARITAFEKDNPHDLYEQAYQMLCHWKQSGGETSATYKVLYEALSDDELVGQRKLAEKYCW